MPSKPKTMHKKKKTSDLDQFVFSFIVGMHHHFESPAKLKKLLKTLKYGEVLTIKREPQNPHDANACAVFQKTKKLGYIPREHSKSLAKKLDRGREFKFYIYNEMPFDQDFRDYAGPGIVGILKKT